MTNRQRRLRHLARLMRRVVRILMDLDCDRRPGQLNATALDLYETLHAAVVAGDDPASVTLNCWTVLVAWCVDETPGAR